MTQNQFQAQVANLTAQLAGMARDGQLGDWLNRHHGVESDTYRQLRASVEEGVAQRWLCNREASGIRYGRVFKPSPKLHGFSVDVVEMKDLAGPHHSHPNGEIDLILPVDKSALFDGRPGGWLVYPPGSAHSPTVSQGRAFVLYLLPDGRIDFTK
jgi:Domain of unknown function (DUF4863)